MPSTLRPASRSIRTRSSSARPAEHAVIRARFEPVAVSADYLAAPDPGPVRLVTTVRKRGRRIGLIDVELAQGEARAAPARMRGLGDSLLGVAL